MKAHNSTSQDLGRRLSTYAATASTLLIVGSAANAQISYSGLQNITLEDFTDSALIDLNDDAQYDFKFMLAGYYDSYTYGSYFLHYSIAVGGILNPEESIYNSWIQSYYGLAKALGAGAYIDQDVENWSSGESWGFIMQYWISYYIQAPGYTSSYSGSLGFFTDQIRYLGVRFHIGEEQHYGWIRATVAEHVASMTIYDWAYEQTPDKGIRAGEGYLSELPPVLDITGDGITTGEQVHTLGLTANETISGLELNDFMVEDGTASNLVEVSTGIEYTVDITAVEDGEVWITIPQDAFMNASLTGNDEMNTLYFYDGEGPEIYFWLEREFDSVSNWESMPVHFEFSKEVVGFDQSDVTLVNCQWYDWVVDEVGLYYRVVVNPDADGEVAVGVLAGVLEDLYGHTNPEDLMVSWMHDGTPPSIEIDTEFTGSTTGQITTSLNITFSEWITDFAMDDIDLTNAGDAILTPVSDTEFTLQLTAVEPGTVWVRIQADAAYDVAGNPSPYTVFSYSYAADKLPDLMSIKNVRIFPNPASEELIIESALRVDVKFIDLQGKTVYSKQGILTESLDVSGLQPGVYILEIWNESLIGHTKIIIY